MMKLLLALLMAMAPIIAIKAADDPVTTGAIGRFMQQDELKTYKQLQEYTTLRFAATGFEDFPLTSDLGNASYRSPGKSFLYSLVLPGAGQVYTGSKIKAGIFMAVEVAAWAFYYMNNVKGRDQETTNNQTADRSWSAERYTNWLIEEHGITSDDSTSERTGQKFTHHLPPTKTQQYYEMIGKYDQFKYGWIDSDYRTSDSTSDIRTAYLSDRAKANDQFTKAKTGAIVALANHLLSAFDAALSARRHNSRQDSFGELTLKARLADYEGQQIPKLLLTYRF
jgi:hypothetical protein